MRGWYEENQATLDENQFINLSAGGGGGATGASSSFDYDSNIGTTWTIVLNGVYTAIITEIYYSNNYTVFAWNSSTDILYL